MKTPISVIHKSEKSLVPKLSGSIVRKYDHLSSQQNNQSINNYNLKFKLLKTLQSHRLPTIKNSRSVSQGIKNIDSIMIHAKSKQVAKQKYKQNLNLIDLYLGSSSKQTQQKISYEKPVQINQLYERCYSKNILSEKLDRLLKNKRILEQLKNDEIIMKKISNIINKSPIKQLIKKIYSQKMQNQQLISQIYDKGQIKYDIAAQLLQIEQKLHIFTINYKQKELDEIGQHVNKSKKQIYEHFKHMNYRLAKKSYIQEYIKSALKKINIQISQIQPNQQIYNIYNQIKNEQDKIGKFPRINQLVMNHYKQISQKVQSIKCYNFVNP